MVLAGRVKDATAWGELDALIATFSIAIMPYAEDHALIAREAFLRFGKGRHPTRLNCGDRASCALAKRYAVPLLFKAATSPGPILFRQLLLALDHRTARRPHSGPRDKGGIARCLRLP